MDSSDRPSGALSPWSATPLAPRPAAWDAAPVEPAAAPPAINARVVVRALKRHWWQILSLWLVGSVGLMFLAYVKIKPQYEVFSILEVEPASQVLLTPTTTGNDAFQPYLDTQVLLVTSPDVITGALRDPAVAALPKIRESLDPDFDLRRDIAVDIPRKGTRLIQVRMTDPDPFQAAAIVNAVVKSYRAKARDWTAQEANSQIAMLKEQKQKFEKDVASQKQILRDLLRRAGANPEVELAKPEKPGDNVPQPQKRLAPEDFRQLGNELAQAEVARLEAQARVEFLQEEIKNSAVGLPPTGPPAADELDAIIQEGFVNLPQVAALREKIVELERQHEIAKGRVRNHLTDPSTKHLRDQVADLRREHDGLWERMYPKLKHKYMSGPPEPQSDAAQGREQELRLALQNLKLAQTREDVLRKRYKEVGVEAANANHEIIDVQFARDELEYRETLFDAVRRSLEQRELEQQNNSRIKLIAEASPTRAPASNGRLKIIAAAPLGMLALAVGLFVILEARSGRVADPDELSHRARLGVIGVVPPLPSLGSSSRALSARGQRDEKRKIEEFVQSLDHLRVTLCAHRPGMSPRRCVLITSATGGEGKTTLAAQLAGRCAHAGLMTLLIDADLRRPSLGDLLEVPEGPGLVDVLSGEATPENALVVIGNAGGFHLLPAGTAGQDPSRLLHGDRLERLLAQFRETFDIVIIDAPPVLAVPDALLLGRWTDGAVLAVRHDTSRFPLVERANKRLASIGVPVLGAVINGCRTMESSYGSYRYTPYAAADAPAAGPGPAGQDD